MNIYIYHLCIYISRTSCVHFLVHMHVKCHVSPFFAHLFDISTSKMISCYGVFPQYLHYIAKIKNGL